MKSTLKRLVPPPVRRVLKPYQGPILDLIDSARGLNVPPRRLRGFVGDGDFTATGEEHLGYFIKYGKLQPDHKVLDVGCGIGRMALPLTRYLSPQGAYYGFDPTEEGIRWCTEHITRRHPNFYFELVDLQNDYYSPAGKYRPENFKFPYQENSFDFVFLTSVFTHLFPVALKNYFSEVSRVLRRGGRSFITYFLLNSESIALTSAGKSRINFAYQLKDCWTADPANPEGALAFDETEIRNLYAANSIKIEETQYGQWCGRETHYGGFQDIIVGTRE